MKLKFNNLAFYPCLLITALISLQTQAEPALKNVRMSALEVFLDSNKQPGEKSQISTDGPTGTFEAEISKDLIPVSLRDIGTFGLSTTLMGNEAISVDQSKLQTPILHGEVNWGRLLREAKVILEIDPQSGVPFATILKTATVGIQDIESNAFDSQMPLPDNGALRGVTRLRSAKAIRIDLNSSSLESLAVAAFKTGVYHPENFGDNELPSSSGMTLLMSKSFSERLKVSGALTKINFPEKAEVRVNTGIAYENKEGGVTVFYNRADFKNNPLYTDATVAQTLGVIKKINKHLLTAERTVVNNGSYSETAIGYKYQITDRTSVGMELRKTAEGNRLGTRISFTK